MSLTRTDLEFSFLQKMVLQFPELALQVLSKAQLPDFDVCCLPTVR